MNLGGFRILLPFFWTSWGVGVLNSAIFNSFHNLVEFWHDFGGPSEFRGGLNPPNPPRYATACYVTNTRKVRNTFHLLMGKLMGRGHFENTEMMKKVILKWIQKKSLYGCGLDSLSLGWVPVTSSSEHGFWVIWFDKHRNFPKWLLNSQRLIPLHGVC